MNLVLLFVMWALVAAVPCQDRGLQTHFSIPRNFLWAAPVLSPHDQILDESKKLDWKEVHRSIQIIGMGWNLFVVAMYAKCGDLVTAKDLFDEMPEKDVVSWNSVISGYASKGMWKEAFKVFEQMQRESREVNSVTWNMIAGGKMQMGRYKEASRRKDVERAFLLFQMARVRSVITWNTIMAGFAISDIAEMWRYVDPGYGLLWEDLVSAGGRQLVAHSVEVSHGGGGSEESILEDDSGEDSEFNQIFITLLDGTTRCLQFLSPTISGNVLKRHFSSLIGIPASIQRLVIGSLNVNDDTLLSASVGFFPSCTLLRLCAGEGGFRGAGRKKSNNLDVCHEKLEDVSGVSVPYLPVEFRLDSGDLFGDALASSLTFGGGDSSRATSP